MCTVSNSQIGQPFQGLGAGCGGHPGGDQCRSQPVNVVLYQECEHTRDNPMLVELLLDAPTMMGVENIAVDTVTLRVVARVLPASSSMLAVQLLVVVTRVLVRASIVTVADTTVGLVEISSYLRPRWPRTRLGLSVHRR